MGKCASRYRSMRSGVIDRGTWKGVDVGGFFFGCRSRKPLENLQGAPVKYEMYHFAYHMYHFCTT